MRAAQVIWRRHARDSTDSSMKDNFISLLELLSEDFPVDYYCSWLAQEVWKKLSPFLNLLCYVVLCCMRFLCLFNFFLFNYA